MIYLLACTCCALAWTVSYRISLGRGCEPVGTMTGIGTSSLFVSFVIAVAEGNIRFKGTAAMLGICGGACMYLAVSSYFQLLKRGARLGISWTIVTLSMVIPTAGSILLWREVPSITGWLSLLLTALSIVVLGGFKEKGSRLERRDIILLTSAFIFSGVAALIAKALVAESMEQYRNIYFISVFATFLFITLGADTVIRRMPSGAEIISGSLMGLAGMGNYWFIIRALRDVPGIVAFPFRTCGSMLLTLAVSRLVWKEQFKPKELAGVALAIAAITLMSI
jgi:hypothetical protein